MSNDFITGNRAHTTADIRIEATELKHPGNFGGQITQQIRQDLQQQLDHPVIQRAKSATPPPLRPHQIGRQAARQTANFLAIEMADSAPARAIHNGPAQTDFFIQSRLDDYTDPEKRARSDGLDAEFRLPAIWRAASPPAASDDDWHWSERSTAAFLGFAAGVLIIVPTVLFLGAGSGQYSDLASLGLINGHRIESQAIATKPVSTVSIPSSLAAAQNPTKPVTPSTNGEFLTATASTAMPPGVWYDSNRGNLDPALSTEHNRTIINPDASPRAAAADAMAATQAAPETRARASISAGDIAAARNILRTAASPQQPHLWFLLAETYNPAVGLATEAPPLRADIAENLRAADIEFARYYYNQALSHGITAAGKRLEQLSSRSRGDGAN